MVGLTRKAGASLHHQLFSILHSGIASGRYHHGSLLPSEDVLAETYNVSRATVRRAMQTLEARGMIDRRPGIGTRVFGSADMPEIQSAVVGLVGTLSNADDFILLSCDFEAASAGVAAELELEEGAQVLKISRIRRVNGIPIRLTQHYLPEAIGRRVDPAMLERKLVAGLLVELGVAPALSENVIGAILADAADADLLEVEVGSPLLELTRIVRAQSGEAVLLQHTITPPQREKLRIVAEADEKGTVA
jgi:GntR family transcriptional regulator